MQIKNYKDKYWVLFLLVGIFICFFILSWLSEGSYGGADDYTHYKFARYAFKHPELFFDHWGKPAFTIIASPFAQFGFMGIKTFNLITGIFTAYVTYRICRIFAFKFSWIAIILVCFTPVYTSMLLSGMTEILFSFVLILSVFLALQRKFLWAALVLSFLPFVRNEGITLFPFFLLYFLIYRKYRAIPLMLTGFVIISIAGSWVYHDIFWVITRMPYTGARDIYGSGPLLYFVQATKSIFGIPAAILGITGLCYWIFTFIKKKIPGSLLIYSPPVAELLLIIGPLFTYYAFHSVLWWKGLGGSLGLTRVMAGIVPLMTILAVQGIEGFSSILPKRMVFIFPFIMAILYLVITTPFKIFAIPVELGPAEKVIYEAGLWTKKHGLNKNRIYYYDPYYWFSLNIDPYDPNMNWMVPHDGTVSSLIPDSSVIVWDSHFGPNEGKLQLNTLMNDTFLQLHQVIRPLQPFATLGGYNYEVCIFQKTATPNEIKSKWKYYNALDSINNTGFTSFAFYDFENRQSFYNGFKLSDTIAFSGKLSCLIEKENEFGPTITFPFKNIKKQQSLFKISVKLYAPTLINWNSVLLTASADHKGRTYLYTNQKPENESNGWRNAELKFILPKPKSKDDMLKVYIWNKDHQRFYIDNFEIAYK